MRRSAGRLVYTHRMDTGWWLTDQWAVNPAWVISWCAWFVISIVLHELAHGWAALWEGDRTPIELGHITWNPVVHMGWMSVIVFALAGIGWGAMPVSPHRFRHWWGDALVSAAGPAMNLLLAGISIVLGGLWLTLRDHFGDPFHANVMVFFQVGAAIGIILALLNMLPVPPLDGSRILATFSRGYAQLISHPNASIIGLVVVFLLVFRVLDPFGWARDLGNEGINAVAGLLGSEWQLVEP